MPQSTIHDSSVTRNLTVEDLLTLDDNTPLALTEMIAPATPQAGQLFVYAKSDGKIYAKNDAGTEYDLTGGGGGGSLPVADMTAIVQGSGDATKQVRFEVDGLTAGVTRVLTVPDADLTLVGTATTQTLTNKTLTTPTIGDFSNAAHNHQNAAGGGTLSLAAISKYGPIHPISAVPDLSGDTFPNIHADSSKYREGMGVAASLGGDRTWHIEFETPPVLPSGTCKLVLVAVADAASGSAKVNPKWVSVADGESSFAASRNAEGTTTLTWAGGENHKDKRVIITLDADTVVAGETIVMDLVFETSGWTLAAVSTWKTAVIWE